MIANSTLEPRDLGSESSGFCGFDRAPSSFRKYLRLGHAA